MVSQRWLELVADPLFAQYQATLTRPNLFRITGQSRWERWHSAFWGWILDPQGSHGLGDYPLRRLLTLALSERCIRSGDGYRELLINALSRLPLQHTEIRPNERDGHEVSVEEVGRFDVLGVVDPPDGTPDATPLLRLLIEVKVDATVSAAQSKRYADWVLGGPPGLPIYFLASPTEWQNAEEAVGDARWLCLTYQTLHDELLEPIRAHPRLDPKLKFVVDEFVHNLSLPHKGIKMATTKQERELAIALYEKHSEAFDALIEILQEEELIEEAPTVADIGTRARGLIRVSLDGKEYHGNGLPSLFEAVLAGLVTSGKLRELALPWGFGRKRYLLSSDENPTHPTGHLFWTPRKFDRYTIECHMNREQGLRSLSKLAQALHLPFKVLEK